MANRLISFGNGGIRFSPFVDVAINGMAAMFVFLAVYVAAVPPNPPSSHQQFQIVTNSLPEAIWYKGYQTVFGVTGGVGRYHYSLAPKEIIDSLQLIFDINDGLLIGNPFPFGNTDPNKATQYELIVTVMDDLNNQAEKTFLLRINPVELPFYEEGNKLSLATDSLPTGNVGEYYEANLGQMGGLPPYRLVYDRSKLPLGLQMENGLIRGIPVIPGRYRFDVYLYDQSGTIALPDSVPYWRVYKNQNSGVIKKSYEIQINTFDTLKASCLLAEARVGEELIGNGLSLGGRGIKYWHALNLPEGITIDQETGILKGTPRSSGVDSLQLEVTDSYGQTAKTIQELNILPKTSELAIAVQDRIVGYTGQDFKLPLGYKGARGPVIWEILYGVLPAGLKLENDSIVGIATQMGQGEFTLRMTDEYNHSLDKRIEWVISPGNKPLRIMTKSLPDMILGKDYSLNLSAVGGAGKYNWKIFDELPPGLILNSDGFPAKQDSIR